MGPETHERLSPSSSERWIACPFSLDAPKLPAGKKAQDGTEGHKWAAGVLLGKYDLCQVPAKWREGVRMYVEHVRANEGVPAIERKWMSIEIPNFGGTCDCLFVENGVCVVYDFKTGDYNVEAKDNAQLLCYSVLAAEHFNIDQFFGVIVQPYVNTYFGTPIKQVEYTPRQVELHRLRVKTAAVSTEKHTGEHCRFCSFRTLSKCVDGMAYGIKAGWK